MRIAQVSHNLDCGGSMALVVALSCELMKRGHEVDVVCLDRPSGSAHEALWIEQLVKSGIGIDFLGRRRGTAGGTAAAKLWWMVQQRRYDVLHSHLPMPDAISGLIRRLSPHRFVHVITVHNTYEPRSRAFTALGSGANVAYCSHAVGKRNPLPSISSTVIPNGIPQGQTIADCRRKVRQSMNLDHSAKIVIAIGRLCVQKNFSAALDGLAVLRGRSAFADLHCLVCGDGEERASLETRVRNLGLENVVRFIGSRTDVRTLMMASDAFLSTSRHEGMPLTVLEALSAGLPCVLSAIEEHHEVAECMPGCVFVSLTPEAIAWGLESVLREPPDHYLLRKHRAVLLQRHSMERCTELYERLYRTCFDSKLSPYPVHS